MSARTSGYAVRAFQRSSGWPLSRVARLVGQERTTLQDGVMFGHVSRTVRRFLALLRLYRRLSERHERLRALYLAATGREPVVLDGELSISVDVAGEDDSAVELDSGLHRHRVDLGGSDCAVARIIGGLVDSGESSLSPGCEIPEGSISDGIRACLRTWTADDDRDRYPEFLRIGDAESLERLAGWWSESYGQLGASTERDLREIAGRLRCSGSSVGAGFEDMPDPD